MLYSCIHIQSSNGSGNINRLTKLLSQSVQRVFTAVSFRAKRISEEAGETIPKRRQASKKHMTSCQPCLQSSRVFDELIGNGLKQ
jgi:hypothetical protein